MPSSSEKISCISVQCIAILVEIKRDSGQNLKYVTYDSFSVGSFWELGGRGLWPFHRAVVLESGLGLESGLETFFYRLGLVLDSLVFGLGLVSDLVIGLAKCSSWSRPSPAIYAFFSLSKQRLACSANG